MKKETTLESAFIVIAQKMKHVKGYSHLLEYSKMNALPCKSCSAISFTFNHASSKPMVEKKKTEVAEDSDTKS